MLSSCQPVPRSFWKWGRRFAFKSIMVFFVVTQDKCTAFQETLLQCSSLNQLALPERSLGSRVNRCFLTSRDVQVLMEPSVMYNESSFWPFFRGLVSFQKFGHFRVAWILCFKTRVSVACSRLSDSGEDTTATAFSIPANQTISEPGTG